MGKERQETDRWSGVAWRVQWCRPWRESLALRETVNLPVAQENRIEDTSSRNIPSELGWGAQTHWRDYVSWVSLGTPPCTPGQGDGECDVWVYLLRVLSCNLDLDTRKKINGWISHVSDHLSPLNRWPCREDCKAHTWISDQQQLLFSTLARKTVWMVPMTQSNECNFNYWCVTQVSNLAALPP